MRSLISRARSLLPERAFYRAVAASYRLRSEGRLLFLDELVPGGCTAVDVGAWWGPWTYWLSRRATSVWSFEPNPEMAAFLSRVVAANVHVEWAALSDRRGTGTLFAHPDLGRDALATLSPAHSEPRAGRVEVPLRRLDDYGLEQVHFMKIDVEGHEFEVLKGAQDILTRCAPTLLVEIDQRLHDQPIERIFEWLQGRGYEGRIRRRGSWASLSSFDVRSDQSQQHDVKSPEYVNDFVFTPTSSRRG